MKVIDPIGRIPAWCNKLATEEGNNRQEALADFERVQAASKRQHQLVKFWMGVAGVLALILLGVVCL